MRVTNRLFTVFVLPIVLLGMLTLKTVPRAKGQAMSSTSEVLKQEGVAAHILKVKGGPNGPIYLGEPSKQKPSVSTFIATPNSDIGGYLLRAYLANGKTKVDLFKVTGKLDGNGAICEQIKRTEQSLLSSQVFEEGDGPLWYPQSFEELGSSGISVEYMPARLIQPAICPNVPPGCCGCADGGKCATIACPGDGKCVAISCGICCR